MAFTIGEFVNSIIEMPGHFIDIAARGPLPAVLLACGALLVGVAVAAGTYLSLGAVLSLFTVESPPQPPQQGE